MSLDDLKKLPFVDDQRCAPLVELAEIVLQKDWHGNKQTDRFVFYVQGVVDKNPQLENDTQKLSIVISIRDCSQGRFLHYRSYDLNDIIEYSPIKKL